MLNRNNTRESSVPLHLYVRPPSTNENARQKIGLICVRERAGERAGERAEREIEREREISGGKGNRIVAESMENRWKRRLRMRGTRFDVRERREQAIEAAVGND